MKKNEKKIKYLKYIPELVSIEFNNTKLVKSYFPSQYELYGLTDEKYKYHFKINILSGNDYFNNYIKQASRNAYSCGVGSDGGFWVKRGTSILENNFIFNYRSKTFYIKDGFFLSMILRNIKIGEFFYSKDLVKEFIYFYLYIEGLLHFPGMAYKKNGKTMVAVIPRGNGKTTYINKIIQNKDIEYISDNDLIIDLKNELCYPTVPQWSAKKSNSYWIFNYIKKNNKYIDTSEKISKMYFALGGNAEKNDMDDFFTAYGAFDYSYKMMKDFILFQFLGGVVQEKNQLYLSYLKKMQLAGRLEIVNIKNYDFDILKA